MINCFEARQEFPAFWRHELSPERSAELTKHLAECEKCDSAFRSFAVTAPVLHSASEPPGRVAAKRPTLRGVPSRRAAGVARGEHQPRRGLAMSAAAMVLVAASLAAYFSATTPMGSLADELTAEPAATQILGNDLGPSSEDFAG